MVDPINQLDQLHDGELFAAVDKTLTEDDPEISSQTNEKIADIHIAAAREHTQRKLPEARQA